MSRRVSAAEGTRLSGESSFSLAKKTRSIEAQRLITYTN